MLFDKIIVVLLEIVFLTFFTKRFIKRYAPENVVLIGILSFFTSIYIYLAINNIYIPVYFQVIFFVIACVIPVSAIYLQYNNIILTRKILYYKMKLKYSNKEYNKTIEYIEKIISIEGRKAEYLYILGQCYKNLQDFINARDSFALAVELDKNDYKSYYELALVLDETNKKEVARVMFDKALKLKPDFYEAEEGLGICFTSQGKFREAINVYKNALKHHPNSYEFYYNIGMLELELREYEISKEAFKKAGEIKPDLYMAHYNLGKIYYLNGDYDDAIETYKKILNSTTYGPRGYYKIAQVYAAKKEYDKSMSSLEYAIELDPSYIKKIEDEFIFSNMTDMINDYLEARKKYKEIERQKHNYMREYISGKFGFFKKKEEVETLEVGK
jgi:tetratricopeptide (TPR) repeat protein